MSNSGSYRMPTTTALLAFDCAARNGSFAGAAKELGTSQPAVSRHIANLERHLDTRLFERTRTGVNLTESGKRFHDAVATGLGIIQTAASEATEPATNEQVVIACSAPASHYLLMPRYGALREALGERTQIRVMIFYLYARNLPLDPVADVVLDWESTIGTEDRTVLFREAVRPVCSPDFAATHGDVLEGPVGGWGGLTFLEPGSPGAGCASWDDWFLAAGRPKAAPRFMNFDNYVYSLQAAVSGQGIALGWRHFVDQLLETGALVALSDDYVERDNHFCGALTEQGRLRPIARTCLSFLQQHAASRVEE